MVERLSRYWWLFALRGLLAVLFGVALIVWPGIGLGILVLLFGAYALVDGVFAMVHAFGSNDVRHRWAHVIEGIVGIAAGVVTFAWPGITALVLLYVIAAWAIVTGVLELIAAFRLRAHIENELWLGLGGVLSILFGLFLFVAPGAGALAVIWIIAAYAILFGITLIALAFRLRGVGSRAGTGVVA
ncbi:MAG TPA: HdeD family acid-resistance protein [Chloroflexota bacterium]|nr:HdeD family acid-resistance protein [Chloroflexota bacterium]